MNNGRVRKSPNTLIRAYKKKNRERNIILQCIVVSCIFHLSSASFPEIQST